MLNIRKITDPRLSSDIVGTRTTEYVRGRKLKRSGVSWIIEKSGRFDPRACTDADVRRWPFQKTDETANSTFRIHNGFLWNSFLSWRKRKKRIRCILKGWVPFFSMSSEKNYYVLPVSTRDYFLEFLFHDRCKQCFRENLYRNLYLANTFLTSSLKKKLLWKTEPVFLKLFFRGK